MGSVVTLIALVFVVIQVLHRVCSGNITCLWTGQVADICQFPCHCPPHPAACDKDSGSCGAHCHPMPIGQACSYARVGFGSSGQAEFDWLTDSRDKTCNTGKTQNVTVILDTPIPVIWVRVVIRDRGAPAKIKVSVGGTGSPQKQCHRVAMDKTDVDYSCSTNDDVSHVTVTGPGVRSLCSLYVIGELTTSEKPVDSHSPERLYFVAVTVAVAAVVAIGSFLGILVWRCRKPLSGRSGISANDVRGAGLELGPRCPQRGHHGHRQAAPQPDQASSADYPCYFVPMDSVPSEDTTYLYDALFDLSKDPMDLLRDFGTFDNPMIAASSDIDTSSTGVSTEMKQVAAIAGPSQHQRSETGRASAVAETSDQDRAEKKKVSTVSESSHQETTKTDQLLAVSGENCDPPCNAPESIVFV